jgi:Cupin superfamily protein
LAALCRALEKVFSAHFQTNVYLSPPNAQGFGTHFDSHDVFVLQIVGSKVWTLNDTLIELPLHEQRFQKDKHVPGPATQELTIRAGDLLYCPRGLFHSARSTDEVSLHVTLLENFIQHADFGTILERFATDFVTSRRPDFSGLLDDQNDTAITLDSRVSPRPHLIYRLQQEGDGVILLFGATRLMFPAAVREPLSFALTEASFKVGVLPGRLDDAGKLVLIRRLLREGLLEVGVK